MFDSPASFHKPKRELRIPELQLASMSQVSPGGRKQKSIHAGSEYSFGGADLDSS